tara:strand:+ start:56 stop:232 length:177 start_codon:yes stop_codon:yes gene_type:complete
MSWWASSPIVTSLSEPSESRELPLSKLPLLRRLLRRLLRPLQEEVLGSSAIGGFFPTL